MLKNIPIAVFIFLYYLLHIFCWLFSPSSIERGDVDAVVTLSEQSLRTLTLLYTLTLL